MGDAPTCRWTAVVSGRAKSPVPPSAGGAPAERAAGSPPRYGMVRVSRPANDNQAPLAYLLRTGLRLVAVGAVLLAMIAYLIA